MNEHREGNDGEEIVMEKHTHSVLHSDVFDDGMYDVRRENVDSTHGDASNRNNGSHQMYTISGMGDKNE